MLQRQFNNMHDVTATHRATTSDDQVGVTEHLVGRGKARHARAFAEVCAYLGRRVGEADHLEAIRQCQEVGQVLDLRDETAADDPTTVGLSH